MDETINYQTYIDQLIAMFNTIREQSNNVLEANLIIDSIINSQPEHIRVDIYKTFHKKPELELD